ncbi:MAG: hypothetical protein PHN69_05680 [Candidatus Pacebacteria bacterium]|nr:hypothetical protein [Candidatus Paceibacterota bacterium]
MENCELCNVNCKVWHRSGRDFGVIEPTPNVLIGFYKPHERPNQLMAINIEYALRQIADEKFGQGGYLVNRSHNGHFSITASPL